jgi:hypothetical protein
VAEAVTGRPLRQQRAQTRLVIHQPRTHHTEQFVPAQPNA